MGNKKKILLLTPDFSPMTGGVARYLSDVADFFKNEILVVASPHADSKRFDEAAAFSVHREDLLFKSFWPKWFRSVLILWRMRKRYDRILVSHLIPFGTAAFVASVFLRKPYFVIVHGMDFRLAIRNGFKSYVTKIVLMYSRRVITNSRALKHEIKSRFDLNHVDVVYPNVRSIRTINKESIQGAPVRLLTVSRLVERKGHDRVLEALATLSESFNLEYHIVGKGPVHKQLLDQVELLKLNNVVFHGFVPDTRLHELYAQSDVFVMPIKEDPFDKEGFGMVFLEAALHGVPSITSKISGVDEAVLHEQTGLLIETDFELIGALKRLLGDSDYRQSLGRAAQDRANNEFARDVQLSKLKSILYE